MSPRTLLLVSGLLSLLIAYTSHASETGDGKALHTRCVGTLEAGAQTPAPVDPYPLMAAGWGPELGNALMASRWAEDWSGRKADGHAPGLKSIRLGDSADLTLGAEIRLRHALSDNARLAKTGSQNGARLTYRYRGDYRTHRETESGSLIGMK